DFLDEGAVFVEFPQARIRAAEVHEDVALRIRRNADGFAESFTGRGLQEIRHRRVADFGHILRSGFLLSIRWSSAHRQSKHGYEPETAIHWILPGVGSRQYIKPFSRVCSIHPMKTSQPAGCDPTRFSTAWSG